MIDFYPDDKTAGMFFSKYLGNVIIDKQASFEVSSTLDESRGYFYINCSCTIKNYFVHLIILTILILSFEVLMFLKQFSNLQIV